MTIQYAEISSKKNQPKYRYDNKFLFSCSFVNQMNSKIIFDL